MKKFLSLFFVCGLLLSFSTGVSHASVDYFENYYPKYEKQASILNELGLLDGFNVNEDNTPIYALQQQASRLQGLIMIIDFLGKTEEAMSYTGKTPFTDLDELDEKSTKYVSYAYSQRYTVGISESQFGIGTLTETDFLIFLLRALGYNEKNGDFSYSNVAELAEKLGLIVSSDTANLSNSIYIDDCAHILYNALNAPMKDYDSSLINHLVDTEVISRAIIETSRINNTNIDLPKLYFEGNIADMYSKSDVRNITVRYDGGLKSFEGFATIKVQGNSSLVYEKKNYTINFFKDANHTEKMKINVGWGEQNKYCLKANWIDKTHARNVVTAKLVSQIQERYDLFSQAPANGAVDGFPVEIYINNEFLGLYTFNIPKDEWMFAMDSDNPNHLVFCGEIASDATCFRKEATFSDWSVEVGTKNEESLRKLNRLLNFVANSSDAEFKESFKNYLNLDSVLNYYIVTDFAYLPDNCSKNMILATYDGTLWNMALYDMDTSWGTHWRGTFLFDYTKGLIKIDGQESNLFKRVEQHFGKELSERYFELREQILTKENVMELFNSFEASIPDDVFQKEIKRWGENIPGYPISQIEEYIDYIIPTLDAKYEKLGAN